MGNPAPAPVVMLVDDQDVQDIMKGMEAKHRECAGMYDTIAPYFETGDLYETAEKLWAYCKKNLRYDIETLDDQRVSRPDTMLRRGYADCKGYALFIGGCLDAMKRAGDSFDWCYRFASYKLLNPEPGHVFIVVNPKSDNIWIDPVLDQFDEHYPYFWKKDRRISAAVAGISGIGLQPMGYMHEGAAIGGPVAIQAGEAILPVPAGYPSNLPVPVWTPDGKLKIRGGSLNSLKQGPGTQIDAIQQMLQPLIIDYAPVPYSIYWNIPNFGSGAGQIVEAGGFGPFGREHDFLQYPPTPSGLEKILMSVDTILPGLTGALANAAVPGSGAIVSSAVSASEGGNTGAASPQALALPGQPGYQAAGSPNFFFLLALMAGAFFILND